MREEERESMAINSRILVADGTRGIDFLLQDMLPEETCCAVDVVQGGNEALEQLRQQGYDMVIANLRRLDPTGLELVQKVRSIYRTTRVMLMTAYDYEEVGVEGKRRFIVYDHLTKPLQQGESVKSVDKIFYGKMAISQKGMLILSDERLAAITQQLANMRSDIEAQSIILSNIVGDLITSVGPIRGMDFDSFIPLVAIGLAASSEMRNYFNEQELGFNLNYHEGDRYAVYSANVGSELLLAMLYDHNLRKSKMGTVWYYSKRAIEDLLEALTPPEPIGGEVLTEIEEEISQKEGLDPFSAAMKAKPQISRSELTPVGLGEEGEGFSFEEAIAQGLISPDLLIGIDETVEQEPLSLEVEPEPEIEPLTVGETEGPEEEPEAEPVAIAEPTHEEEQVEPTSTFSLEEAIAQGLIDPALLGVEDAETEKES